MELDDHFPFFEEACVYMCVHVHMSMCICVCAYEYVSILSPSQTLQFTCSLYLDEFLQFGFDFWQIQEQMAGITNFGRTSAQFAPGLKQFS